MGSFIHVLALRWSEGLLAETGVSWHQALWGRSQCAQCGHVLKPWHLIPLLSFVMLRGRCAFCGTPIAWREGLVEWVLAAAWLALWWRLGPEPSTALWLAWASVLLLLALIDLDTFLLPDGLTLGLMALGLLVSALGAIAVSPLQSLAGAVLGYGLLASVAWVYRHWRGREGLGLGDAKLLAAMGAWLGPWILPMLLWMAALMGLMWGLIWRWRGHAREDGAFPFGPSLALAGLLTALWPNAWEMMAAWLLV